MQALCDIIPEAERATQAIYPSPLLSPLEAKVRKTVQALVEGGQLTGCQVIAQSAMRVRSAKRKPITDHQTPQTRQNRKPRNARRKKSKTENPKTDHRKPQNRKQANRNRTAQTAKRQTQPRKPRTANLKPSNNLQPVTAKQTANSKPQIAKPQNRRVRTECRP